MEHDLTLQQSTMLGDKMNAMNKWIYGSRHRITITVMQTSLYALSHGKGYIKSKAEELKTA